MPDPQNFTHFDGTVYSVQRLGNLSISKPNRYVVHSNSLGACSGLPVYAWTRDEAVIKARAHYAKRLLERAAQTN